MRAALSWSRSAGKFELALTLARALEMYWIYTNPSEGMRWYDELLSEAPDVPLPLRAAALLAYGGCANPAGEDALAERAYLESFEAYTALGDRHGVAHLLVRLGSSALYRDDLVAARDFGAQSLTLSREVGETQAEALALWVVGEAEQRLGNPQLGIELFRQSADLAGEIGFMWQRTRMLRRLADWALEHGDPAEARRDLEEALRLSHELGDRISVVFALAGSRASRRRQGELEQRGPALGCGRGRGGDRLASARGTASASASPARCSPSPARRSTGDATRDAASRSTRRSSARSAGRRRDRRAHRPPGGHGDVSVHGRGGLDAAAARARARGVRGRAPGASAGPARRVHAPRRRRGGHAGRRLLRRVPDCGRSGDRRGGGAGRARRRPDQRADGAAPGQTAPRLRGLRGRGRARRRPGRRGRPRRPGAAVGGHPCSRRDRGHRPRRAPAQGFRAGGGDLPARRGPLPAAEDDLEHESPAPRELVPRPRARAGRGRRSRAGRRAARDADGPSTGWVSASTCSRAAATPIRASRRCGRRSSGATSSCPPTSSGCSGRSPSSTAAARWTRSST